MKKLITEEMIRTAAKGDKIIYIEDDLLLTPSARDLSKILGVEFKSFFKAASSSTLSSVNDFYPAKTIAIACDHGGYAMKQALIPFLQDMDYAVHDLGTDSETACDYPDFAFTVAKMVAGKTADCGIMLDSVGIGSAMAANRITGILAAKCNNAFEARSAREHNYANYLTIGAKMVGIEIAKDIIKNFLHTPGGAERHKTRVEKILTHKL